MLPLLGAAVNVCIKVLCAFVQCVYQTVALVKRVRMRVVVVVVVVRELLFLVMSVICVRIRGHGAGQRLPHLLTTFVRFLSKMAFLP